MISYHAASAPDANPLEVRDTRVEAERRSSEEAEHFLDIASLSEKEKMAVANFDSARMSAVILLLQRLIVHFKNSDRRMMTRNFASSRQTHDCSSARTEQSQLLSITSPCYTTFCDNRAGL